MLWILLKTLHVGAKIAIYLHSSLSLRSHSGHTNTLQRWEVSGGLWYAMQFKFSMYSVQSDIDIQKYYWWTHEQKSWHKSTVTWSEMLKDLARSATNTKLIQKQGDMKWNMKKYMWSTLQGQWPGRYRSKVTWNEIWRGKKMKCWPSCKVCNQDKVNKKAQWHEMKC